MADDFRWIDIVENTESKTWIKSYSEPGYFEIYVADSEKARSLYAHGRYIVRHDDDMIGVIERIQIKKDDDGRHMLLVSGRCAKSLLARRVIYPQQFFTGSVWNRMYWMVHNNASAPKDTRRKIPNLEIEPAGDAIGPSAQTQCTGDNLMDAVSDLVASNNMGWRVYLQDNKFVVGVYAGTDRTIEG